MTVDKSENYSDMTNKELEKKEKVNLTENPFDSEYSVSSFQFIQGQVFLSDPPSRNNIPKSWILLDNCSTVDVFCNPNLLSNIRKSNIDLTIECTSGECNTNLIRDLRGYGTVWFHPRGIANIFSLSRVKNRYNIRYDSDNGLNYNEFVLHKDDGTEYLFKESKNVLYYYDTDMKNNEKVLVNTVDYKKSLYSHRQVARPDASRKIQNIRGRPSEGQYRNIILHNFLPNFQVMTDNIRRAEDMYGTNVGSLKGKTIQTTPSSIHTELVPLKDEFLEMHHVVTVCSNIMTVNSVMFMITISKDIGFITSQFMIKITWTPLRDVSTSYSPYTGI